jgi:hypothetical protein
MTKTNDYYIDKICFKVVTQQEDKEQFITINSNDLSDQTLSFIFKDIDKKLEYK